MVDETKTGDEVIVDDPNEEEDTPDLFDAVSDAIDEQTVGLDTSADDDAPTGDNDDGTPAEESGNEEEGTPADEGGDSTPAEDEPTGGEGEGAPTDADKDPVSGDDVSRDTGKEKEADAAGKDTKVDDPVNDPIPEELAEKTQDRIRTLAERVKVAEAGVTERTGELDEMITMVQDTGTSGEQYGQMLGFMKLFNSTDEADQRAAFKVMQGEMTIMAAKLGETIPGIDPLAAHADLQAEIEAGTLTGDRAIEIANTRTREAASAAITKTNTAEATAQGDIDQAVADAKGELAVFENAHKTDPQWKAKKDILVPALRSVMRTIHPSLWKSTFEESYNKLVLPEAVALAPKPKVPTPLRPKAPAGEGSKQPSTMAEAIELSLGGSIDD